MVIGEFNVGGNPEVDKHPIQGRAVALISLPDRRLAYTQLKVSNGNSVELNTSSYVEK